MLVVSFRCCRATLAMSCGLGASGDREPQWSLVYCDFLCGHFGLGVGFPGGGIGEGAEYPLQNVSLEISHGIGEVEGRAVSF